MTAAITTRDIERQIRTARNFRDEYPDCWTDRDADELSDLEDDLIALKVNP